MNWERSLHVILVLLAPLALRAQPAATMPAAAGVIVLANADDPGSLRVAMHYAEVRGVPTANIIALPMPQVETITWTEFLATIWEPLQGELVRRKWIDAIPMELRDDMGRRKHAMSGHRISYLVVCRGIPLRIGHDPERYRPLPPVTDNPFFRTNEAAVDSELSLLATSDHPASGFLANPLYGNNRPTSWQLDQVVKVSRLDGPTVEDACALPDRAIAAEHVGLLGRAYVDLGGIRPEGDRWLEAVVKQLTELGFDPSTDRSTATFSATARFDAPVLYFGWYAQNLNGPFALPGFQFPPGAIAVHIHSDSAATLRSAQTGWSGPLVARGVTATVGNVFEPYLQLLHRPDLLLAALARGETFGDAAYYAEPVLSWQSIAIGDPLYRPFALRTERREKLPPREAGYAMLRELNRPRATDAWARAEALQRERPSLALAYELALRQEQAGNRGGAAQWLAFAATVEHFAPDEWGLAHLIAQGLVRLGAPRKAHELYLHLLHDPALPAELRAAWLGEAHDAAAVAGLADAAAAWAAENK